MKKMFYEGNQIHNFMSSSGSGSVINYGSGSGSNFLTSYSSGSGSKSQKVTVPTVPVPVPVPVPQHCIWIMEAVLLTESGGSVEQSAGRHKKKIVTVNCFKFGYKKHRGELEATT